MTVLHVDTNILVKNMQIKQNLDLILQFNFVFIITSSVFFVFLILEALGVLVFYLNEIK